MNTIRINRIALLNVSVMLTESVYFCANAKYYRSTSASFCDGVVVFQKKRICW